MAMTSFSFAWVVGWLFLAPATAQDIRVMDAALTLSPRYYQAGSPRLPLGRRQALQPCSAGQHSCYDIGPLGATSCCPDDTYCLVDPSGTKAQCCAIGSVCGSPCAASEYQCLITLTITTVSPSTTTTSRACCPRQCIQTSMFGCPSSMGGGCCSYGQTCASSSQCLWTSTPTSVTSALVSQVPPGCTTSQIACPSSLGGGCCGASQSCTVGSGGPLCVAVTTTPTASGVVAVPQNKGLGTGAKAGIGIGAVVLAGLIVGAVTWLVLRRRSRRWATSSRADFSSDNGTSTAVGRPGDSSLGRSQSPPPRRMGLGILGRDRAVPQEMTESPSGSPASPRSGRLRGLAADYFGPTAVPGPFTEEATTNAGSPSSAATTPPGGNNRDRAVPKDPHSPDDITAPVEIDSRAKQRDASDTIAGRFELYGTEVASPSSDPSTPYDELVVSPYTPSPGAETGHEGATPQSPPVGHARM